MIWRELRSEKYVYILIAGVDAYGRVLRRWRVVIIIVRWWWKLRNFDRRRDSCGSVRMLPGGRRARRLPLALPFWVAGPQPVLETQAIPKSRFASGCASKAGQAKFRFQAVAPVVVGHGYCADSVVRVPRFHLFSLQPASGYGRSQVRNLIKNSIEEGGTAPPSSILIGVGPEHAGFARPHQPP